MSRDLQQERDELVREAVRAGAGREARLATKGVDFGVIRAIYWSKETPSREPIPLSTPMQFAIGVCVVGMFWLGLMPGVVLRSAETAVGVLK